MVKLGKSLSSIQKTQASKKMKEMMTKSDNQMLFHSCIGPTSSLHIYRDLFYVLASMYYSISFPIRLCISYRSENLFSYFNASFLLDYFLDFIFIFDILLQMRYYAFVTYIDGREVIVSEPSQISHIYLRSHRCKIDIICSLPLDLFAFILGYPLLMRLPKLIRLQQIPGAVSDLMKHLVDCMQLSVNESYLSSIIMFLGTILLIIWSSSGWNAIRGNETFLQSTYWYVVKYKLMMIFFSIHIFSPFIFVRTFTTLTTVGYGDLTPNNFLQTAYSLAVGIIGVTFSAGIIANVTSFIHNTDIAEDCIEHERTCVKVK